MKPHTTKNRRSTAALTALLLTGIVALLIGGCAGRDQGSADGARLIARDNGICEDTKTGKMWQIGHSKTINSLDGAKSYTASLQTAGYQDWRLPTVGELYELYLIFDLHENGNCELEAEGTFWSGEEDLEGRVGTWELDDNCDPERQYIPKQKGKVRAIRS